MTKFDSIVEEQLILLDQSWKKYAAGAALGAASLLGVQHGLEDTHRNHDLTRTKMVQQQNDSSATPSTTPSRANVDKPIKSKHNINEYKVGLMAKFNNTETTSGNAKSSGKPTYKYTVMKEVGDMYPNYQMVKIYDGRDYAAVTIRFSKDGSQITNIIKKPNLYFPPDMQKYIQNQFGITL